MLNFPKETEVNKVIAKQKFYDNANISPTLKECFVNDIEKIIWANISCNNYKQWSNVALDNLDEFEQIKL